ncbi:glycosyltransferase family 9 protein, partial [bacterium]|nr:glycosyltransferase family 9 protein [bacterium]
MVTRGAGGGKDAPKAAGRPTAGPVPLARPAAMCFTWEVAPRRRCVPLPPRAWRRRDTPAADGPVQDWLLLRFSSLGDLCLLGWSLSALADAAGRDRPRVTVATKAIFSPLVARFHGVDGTEPLAGSGLGPLRDLAGRLRARRWHRVIDAHHVLRSHALLALLGRRADARLAKDTAARLRLLAGGPGSSALTGTMVDRFDRCLLPDRTVAGNRRPPLASLAGVRAEDGPRPLGLAPGARWAAKRWPEPHWIALIESLATAGEHDLRLFLGPD